MRPPHVIKNFFIPALKSHCWRDLISEANPIQLSLENEDKHLGSQGQSRQLRLAAPGVLHTCEATQTLPRDPLLRE